MKVSIIVPMYNSEKYIKRCLESLINQTYSDIEIIVIDDGSTDNSYSQVELFDDSRVMLYRKDNGGVSSARNLGLLYATGDLIMFVDADDYIDFKMIESLIKKVDNPDTTFILCNNYELYKDKIDKRIILNQDNNSSHITQLELVKLIASGRAGLVCSKLVSRKIIIEHQIKFDEKIRIGEDQLFFLQIVQYVKQINYVNECLYYYDRTNENSATIGYQKDLLFNFLYLYQKIEELLNEILVDKILVQKILNDKCIFMFLHCLQNEIRDKRIFKFKVLYSNVKEIINHFVKLIDLNSYIPTSTLTNEIYKSFLNPDCIQIIKIITLAYLLKLKS